MHHDTDSTPSPTLTALIERLESRALIEGPDENFDPDKDGDFPAEITWSELAEIAALLREAATALRQTEGRQEPERILATVDGRCGCKNCEARTMDIYRMIGACYNCGAKPILMLFRSGDPTAAQDCPLCGKWHGVHSQRRATDAEIPAPEGRQTEAQESPNVESRMADLYHSEDGENDRKGLCWQIAYLEAEVAKLKTEGPQGTAQPETALIVRMRAVIEAVRAVGAKGHWDAPHWTLHVPQCEANALFDLAYAIDPELAALSAGVDERKETK